MKKKLFLLLAIFISVFMLGSYKVKARSGPYEDFSYLYFEHDNVTFYVIINIISIIGLMALYIIKTNNKRRLEIK